MNPKTKTAAGNFASTTATSLLSGKTQTSANRQHSAVDRLKNIGERGKLALYGGLLAATCIGGAVAVAALPH